MKKLIVVILVFISVGANAQKLIVQLKDKVKTHKKSTYTQQVDEKKGKN